MSWKEKLSALSQLTLVACDASYKTPSQFAVGEILSPFSDSAQEDEAQIPATFQIEEFANWTFVRDVQTLSFDNPDTGFSAVLFANAQDRQVIVAFTGSNGSNAQDWWSNLNLGMTQWNNERGGEDVINYLLQSYRGWTIHFTGQSLGGALAQYAAHDYARALDEDFDPALITLTTFNGLGATEGLEARYKNDPANEFSPNILADVSTAHYTIANDLISRLGGDNLNESETYQLDFRKYGPAHAIQSYLGIVDSHRIESGFYRGFERYATDFSIATKGHDLPSLSTASIQPIAAAFGNLLNMHATSDRPGEAMARILAGVLGGLVEANATDTISFWNEIVDHLDRANNVPNPIFANTLKALGASTIAGMRLSPGAPKAAARASLLFAVIADLLDAPLDTVGNFIASRAEELLPDGTIDPELAFGLQQPAVQARAERRVALAGAMNVVRQSQLPGAEISSLELDVAAYLASVADPEGGGVGGSLDFLAGTARDHGREVSRVQAEASEAHFEAAKMSGELTVELYDATVATIKESIEKVAKGIGNAFESFTRKSSDTDFALARTVSPFAEVRHFTSVYDEILADASLSGVVRDSFENAQRIVERAAQAVVVAEGRPIRNPFDTPGFNPDSYTLAAAPLVEGAARTLTAFLPYEVGPEGQWIRFALPASVASLLSVLMGAEPINAASDGSFTLQVAAGRRDVTFGLLANQDIDTDLPLTLSSTLVDAAGEATHATYLEATILVDADDESGGVSNFDVEYHGDWGIKLYPSQLGNPYEIERDARFAGTPGYWNLERDPSQPEGNVVEGLVIPIVGTDGPDRLFAGTRDSNVRVDGYGGNDLIHGTPGVSNVLIGDTFSNFLDSSGDDVIEGGVTGPATVGAPTIYGRVVVNSGDDTIFGGPGDDLLFADTKDRMQEVLDAATPRIEQKGDWVTAGRGEDRVYGSAADDALFGGGGADVIFGGAGNDILDGDDDYENAGSPWWQVDPGGYTVTFHPVDNVWWENTGYEYYRQWGGADVLDGGAGDDFLFGMWGDDTLLGGAGQDWLEGWEGADVLYGGDGGDILFGEFGRFEQPWDRRTGSSHTVSPGAVGFTGDASVVQLLGNDFVDGGAGDDVIYGEGGDDSLVGGDGNDEIYGDASYLPDEYAGNDVLDGGSGADTLMGQAGNDQLFGGDGDDFLDGGSGDDWLDGGAGDDVLDGGADADILHGRVGNDRLYGGDGSDVLHGGEGNDVLLGGHEADELHGDAGADEISGGDGNDVLYGGAGEDVINGDAGDDLIDGGAGVDVVRGGPGNDIYLLDFGYGHDVIEDAEGSSRIRFGSGIGPGHLQADLAGLTLTLAFGVGSDSLSMDLSQVDVGGVEFDGGAAWSKRDLINFAPKIDIAGSATGDLLQGSPYVGSALRGFEGDDWIHGGQYADVLDGGDGSDILDGGEDSDTYFYSGSESGVDIIADSSIESVRYLDWYYGLRGIEDWRERASHGGTWRARNEGGAVEYYESEADAEAAGVTALEFIAPLAEHAPRLARGDEMIEQLRSDGILATDVIEFGPALGLDDLDITVAVDGLFAADHPESPWGNGGAVSVRWAGGGGLDLVVGSVDAGFAGEDLILGSAVGQEPGDGSWRGYRLGEGIEGVRFADGNFLSIDEFLANATVIPVHGNFFFQYDRGEQTIDRRYPAVEFAEGIGSSQVSFGREGLDLLISAAGSLGRVQGWYSDAANLPQMRFEFVGEPSIDAAEATLRGLEMRGTTGPDVLLGLDQFRDFLFGSAGDDYLDGAAGKDTYSFDIGDGADTIVEAPSGEADPDASIIVFGEGIHPWQVHADLGSLVLRYGEGDSIRFTAFDPYDPYSTPVFERLEFADGSALSYEDVLANGFYLNGTEGDDEITGTGVFDQISGLGGNDALSGAGGRDVLYGGEGDDTLLGGDGNDDLFGGAGDDTLAGGPGDFDALFGEGGADTYVYAAGDGWDEIVEWSETPGEVDRLRLEGLAPGDVRVTRSPWSYYLVVGGADRLMLDSMPIEAAAAVERIEFADGTVWTPASVEAHVELLAGTEGEDILWGSAGADFINGLGAYDEFYGNGGDDLLVGGDGDDFYYFAAGDGHDTVDNYDADGSYDSIYFADAASADAVLSRAGMSLVISAGADSVALANWYLGTDYAIDSIYFEGDGGYWDAATIEAMAPAAGNAAPVVANPLADLSIEAGTSFSFDVPEGTFSDEDLNDTLALSATPYDGGALPAWLNFDSATALFSGSPALTDIGVSHILVTAVDAAGESAHAEFALVVRVPAGMEATGSAGDDVLYGGAGGETLTARGGSDYLFGDVGNDLLKGGAGNDVLQGGAGDDVLRGGKGQNVLEGGAGDDLIFGGAGSAFIAGGAGNDTLRVGSGNDVIAFNAGDGMDTIYGGRDGGNTLSFGGGIRYSDLTLSKSGKDLVVSTGAGEGVTLKNWYGGNHSTLNLQIVLDATEDFDAASSDPLYNSRVQTYDFLGMVSAFDAARAATPGLKSWEMTNALLAFHLSGADDMALGGDLAYWYGKNRTLAAIGLQSALQAIGTGNFGSEAQSLRPFSGLQEGFVKLA